MTTPQDLDETVRLVKQTDRRILAARGDVRDRDRLAEVVPREWQSSAVIASSAAGFASVSTEFATVNQGAAAYTAAKHGVIGVMGRFAGSLTGAAIPLEAGQTLK